MSAAAVMSTMNGGVNGHKASSSAVVDVVSTNGFHEPSLEELESELPVVHYDQLPLGELLSRVVQSIYAELCELAETLPNMSDAARKRTIADWVVKTKKQVVKVYAVAKWARDADTVQKSKNIIAFILDQNQQFLDVVHHLSYAKEILDSARLRNHDLLTSLDVLTTGSYRRLPSAIKKLIIRPTPLTDDEVHKVLSDVEDAIRYRLRMNEIVPIEMSKYHIAGGRVHFTAPKLFHTSLCLAGAQRDDGWFFVSVEFLFKVGGDQTGVQEFPRIPTGLMKRHITDGVDGQLGMYVPLPPEQQPPPESQIPPRPRLPEGTVDAPLVRVFNFLQMMSLSYQLEILLYQAQRMCSLGWGEYLQIATSRDRKALMVSYWIRKTPPHLPGRPPPPPNRSKLPSFGGTLIISISQTRAPARIGGGPARSAKDRILAELQQKSKVGAANPSDEVESMKFQVKWEPMKGAVGVIIDPQDAAVSEGELAIDSNDLDFDALLRKVIRKHAKAVLKIFRLQLQRGPTRTVFSPPGEVTLIEDGRTLALRVHLCADEVVFIAIDPRTGRLNMRDTGDLAAAGRGPRFSAISDRLNENPAMLPEALVRLRLHTITDLAEQKANYLGLQTFRIRNFPKEELQKLGSATRGMLYIQLSRFPNHYLVLVITDEEFRYALISVKVMTDTVYANMIMEDIGWLDVKRIHGDKLVVTPGLDESDPQVGQKRKRSASDEAGKGDQPIHVEPVQTVNGFNLETQVLRELYSYCCARVAYTKVEQQLKLRGIPYTHVNPASGVPVTSDLMHIQSSLARSVPGLCVQSSDILSGAPAAEAAMPNIRVIPLNWWSDKKAQVVTCVKLKYVQQPMGKRAGTSRVIRPSKRIIYDTLEAVVSFLSEDVDKCVDEFLEEWARVSKIVVIANEVAQMAKEKKWPDVRLLSFDLQTVEFAYAADYNVSITCTDQLSPGGGSYDLRFSRAKFTGSEDRLNPHDDSEPFMRSMLRQGRLSESLHRLVSLLRDTLPIVVELEDIQSRAVKEGHHLDAFPKSAGWYRLLYGDFRHALDFRLMSGGRVIILDASHSLYGQDKASSMTPEKRKRVGVSSLTGKVVQKSFSDADRGLLVLQPIPGIKELFLEAVKEANIRGSVRGKVAPIDVGIVCDVSVVRFVGRAVHERVWKKLQENGWT